MVRGTNLFDGVRTVEAATVTIDGERIVAVGQDRPPPGAEVIDLGDATLLPGLVDCHQHLCFENLSEDAADTAPDVLVEQARRSARRALAAGVTTVRDLGDRSYVSLPLRHEPDLPTLLCAGPPITTPNGHCWYLGGEVDPGSGGSALRAAVRERVERGCDVVKIMVTGGFLTPTNPMWESQFSLDDLRIVVAEAHRHGLPVAAHCHGVEGIEHAVRAKVDSIEHCSFLDENLDVNATGEMLAASQNRGFLYRSRSAGCPHIRSRRWSRRIRAASIDARSPPRARSCPRMRHRRWNRAREASRRAPVCAGGLRGVRSHSGPGPGGDDP